MLFLVYQKKQINAGSISSNKRYRPIINTYKKNYCHKNLDRIDPNNLQAFKNNPYTQSLHSVA